MQRRSLFLPLLLVLLLSGRPGLSQVSLDSLHTLLQHPPADSTKIDLYLELHKNLLKTDTAQLSEYLRKAILLSEKTDDKKRIARSYLQLARYYDQKGNLPEAHKALAKVAQLLVYFRDTPVEATFYMLRGIIYYYEGNYNLAVSDLWSARSRYEELGDSVTVASCYLTIGVAYMEMNNLDKSLEYYEKSRELYQSAGNEKGVAMASGNMGVIYKRKEDYDRALDFYHQSLAVHEKFGYTEEVQVDLSNIGSLYLAKGDYPKAIEFYARAKELAESLGSQVAILNSTFNLATVESKSGNHRKAIPVLQETIRRAKELNYKSIIKDAYQVLSDSYQATNEFSLALSARKEYEAWKDSLMNENHLNQVKELELKYQTAEKDKQITLLAKEKELKEKEADRQATLTKASMAGLVLVSLLAGLVVYLFRQRLRNQKLLAAKNEELREAQFSQQLSELEMKALRAQVNPHFLFNCMNSINRMILQNDTANASLYLTKFSRLVRLILENTETARVSLENELAMLESYIQLEALRFKGKINYRIQVDETIEPESTYLPSMVLQPFVENAIWHGLMHKADAGTITIAIREEADRLLCRIEDDGVGREKARVLQEKSLLKRRSMGVKITEERLRLLSKEKLEELIRITDLKDSLDQVLGTRVDIMVPIS